MANFNLSFNLLGFHNACVLSPKNKSGMPVRGIFIPISDNNLIEGKNGTYASLAAWETENNQFGNSHMVKLSATREQRASMPQDQLRDYQCIIGNMKPFNDPKQRQTTQPAPDLQTNDLPL